MSLVKWDPSFSVKITVCDDHHKKLFAIINTLHDAMLAGQGATMLDPIVKELLDYTRFHFSAEAALLEKAAYPSLAAHRIEHQRFINKVDEFRQDITNRKGSSVPVLAFLKDWLSSHIKKTDQRYSDHMNSHGIS
jgi:hemerythrin-like metal-binding protein